MKVFYSIILKHLLPMVLAVFQISCIYTRVIDVPASVAIEDPAFYRTISGISGRQLLEGNDIKILNTGKETFRHLFALIESAKKSINFEIYLYRDDAIGRKFTDLICKKAKEGITVNFIIDSFGARNIGKDIPVLLEESGVNIYYYRPFKLARYTRYFHRNHRKMIIIDGKIGITGGFNITDEWDESGTGEKDKWRDVQLLIKGPAIFQLQSIFMEHWFEVSGKVLVGDEFFPDLSSEGNVTARIIGSSPKSGSSSLQAIYLFALNSARKYFWMENAYFVPDKNSVKAFINAAKRGVDIRLIVPSMETTDYKAPIYAARNYYWRLLHNNVKIFEYSKQKLHSKFAVADSIWTTIGSTNFDNRSFRHHEELNVNIYDRDFAKKMEDIFNEDIKFSRQLDIKKFKKRSISSRIKEFFFKLLEEQL